jgi:hypothetical protein
VTGHDEAVQPRAAATGAPLLCPFDLTVEAIDRFVNCELADHPVYDSLELQWFDDEVHGRGMLAFLSHRDDRRVDYYVTPGLRLDRSSYEIGGGTGVWLETTFEAERLEVGPEGVVVDVRFRDRDGREVEVRLDDRDAGPRRTGELLAPVGTGIEAPVSLALVVLRDFDLVRRTATPPRIRLAGEDVATGVLPGATVHRRHLVKAAAPLVVATVCRSGTRVLPTVDATDPEAVLLDPTGGGVAGVTATDGTYVARLTLQPPLPPLGDLPDGTATTGTWRTQLDGRPLTGGTWRAQRHGEQVELGLDVTEPWQPPRGLPPLLRFVTRVMPTFRRWPTTYRWRADVDLQEPPRMVSRWERVGDDRGERYRKVTRSAGGGDPDRTSGARRLAVASSAAIAVLYLAIASGILSVGRAEVGELGVLGVAGGVFAALAVGLWRLRRRWLWAAAAVLQVLLAGMYVAIAPDRLPPYEVWGLTIRGLSLLLLVALVRLLFARRTQAS